VRSFEEHGELLAVGGAEGGWVGAGEAELLGDVGDLAALRAGDRAVGGGDRVEAGQQLAALLGRRGPAELAGHDVVLGAAQQLRLGLRDLHDHVRLVLGEPRDAADDVAHGIRLFRRDLHVSVRNPRQHIGERRQVACCLGGDPLETFRDLADAARLAGPGRLRLLDSESQTTQQRHAALPISMGEA
jgi:hypothetical protein